MLFPLWFVLSNDILTSCLSLSFPNQKPNHLPMRFFSTSQEKNTCWIVVVTAPFWLWNSATSISIDCGFFVLYMFEPPSKWGGRVRVATFELFWQWQFEWQCEFSVGLLYSYHRCVRRPNRGDHMRSKESFSCYCRGGRMEAVLSSRVPLFN